MNNCFHCGGEAKYVSKSGVYRCSEVVNQCPAIVNKIKEGMMKNAQPCPICGEQFPVCSINNHIKAHEHYSKCPVCGKDIFSSNRFCSHSCAAIYSNRKRTGFKGIKKEVRVCKNCGKIIKGKSIGFCNIKCSSSFRHKEFIDLWLDNKISGNTSAGMSKHIKKYLIDVYGNKCSLCGWSEVNIVTGKVPIEVDHIDGDWKNNSPDNLRLLCPNCHSLTPTYRGLNKGKGNSYYKNRYSKK